MEGSLAGPGNTLLCYIFSVKLNLKQKRLPGVTQPAFIITNPFGACKVLGRTLEQPKNRAFSFKVSIKARMSLSTHCCSLELRSAVWTQILGTPAFYVYILQLCI